MAKVRGRYYVEVESMVGKRVRWAEQHPAPVGEIMREGTFLEFAQESDIYNPGDEYMVPIFFTVAIIKCDDGSVAAPTLKQIQFVE